MADNAVPFVDAGLGEFGELTRLPASAIDREAVAHADVLVVRSVTPVNAALVDGSSLRFVASATAGTDHVDKAALDAAGVGFANAPGCNAMAVVEVVLAALALRPGGLTEPRTIGIVGYGQIGRRLALALRGLGHRVLANDPPLSHAGSSSEPFVSKAELLAAADVVTLHVPLVRDGPFPTQHWIDGPALARLRPGAWVINACRGSVVDSAALRLWLARGAGSAVLDVWEGEPNIPWSLLELPGLALGTPHVAGYSLEGKIRATCIVAQSVARFAGKRCSFDPAALLGPAREQALPTAPGAPLEAVCEAASTIRADARSLRAIADRAPADRASAFEAFRRAYRFRREFQHFAPPPVARPLWDLLRAAETVT